MSRYTITESVGASMLPVHSYEDLHKHHPSAGHEPYREYGTLNGEFEEIRRVGGHTFVKKDFVLSQGGSGPVRIPAPVSGYAHFLRDDYNTVQIYDMPYGTPGAQRLGQVLHMVRGSSPFAEGAHVAYGHPLGDMGDTGSAGSVHAHVELEVGQFQRYIRDIDNGTIRPGMTPRNAGTQHAAEEGGALLLLSGSRGAGVVALQKDLIALGYRGADGAALAADGVFGPDTLHAVAALQRDRHLAVDGKVGPHTAAAVSQARATQDVREWQTSLNALGYTDPRGRALEVDGVVGPATRHAVEAFQRDHRLTVDGKVGPRTHSALAQALAYHREPPAAASAAMRLDDPAHPDHGLYTQAFALMLGIDERMGRRSDGHTRRLAAAAVPTAKAQGLTRIDAITLNEDGSRTFLVQNEGPIRRVAEMATATAVSTSIEQSSATAAQFTAAVAPMPVNAPATPRSTPVTETPQLA